MNEINPNYEKKINSGDKSKKTSKYENMKTTYNNYTKAMQKSDFANSYTRYQIELNMLKDLKTLAQQEGKTEETEYIRKKYATLSEKFTQFGIKLKSFDEI